METIYKNKLTTFMARMPILLQSIEFYSGPELEELMEAGREARRQQKLELKLQGELLHYEDVRSNVWWDFTLRHKMRENFWS